MNTKLFSLLRTRAINRFGLELYTHDDAIMIVEICMHDKIRILGIDAFDISDGFTHPVMEFSIDYTSTSSSECKPDAKEFLKMQKNLNLVYEIVL